MKVTKDIQRRIINELTKRGWSLSEFSERIGMHRTYATKFLSQGATMKELNQDVADKISDVLGIPLRPIQTMEGNVSPTAIGLSKKAEDDAKIAQLLELIYDLANPPEPDLTAHLPVVLPKELQRIGAEITKIVQRSLSPKGDYSPKIAKEVLQYLREYYAAEESKGKK